MKWKFGIERFYALDKGCECIRIIVYKQSILDSRVFKSGTMKLSEIRKIKKELAK